MHTGRIIQNGSKMEQSTDNSLWNISVHPGDAEFKLLRLFRERKNYDIQFTLPFNSLLLVLDGGGGSSSFTNTGTGQTVVPENGDVILIPAMMPVWSRPRKEMLYIAIHFSLEYLPGCEVFDRNSPISTESDPAGVAAVNRQLEQEVRLKALFHVQAFALACALRHWPEDFETRARRVGPFASILNHVRKNIRADMNVAELAERFGESRKSFSRKFHRETGLSPKTFLDQELFRKVQLLIADETLKIDDIAERAGFSSGSYFSVFFKRLSGLTPGEYRTKILKSKI